MTIDIYGNNPTSAKGGYFPTTAWEWRPLATFLTTTYPELTRACTYWQSNNADGLDAEGSVALAAVLRRDLSSGVVTRYARERKRRVAALPKVECVHCTGTGVRTVGHGDQPEVECNGCGGAGKVDHPATLYMFDQAKVRAFATFLADCGGFQIR
jgi:hypothetical protein